MIFSYSQLFLTNIIKKSYTITTRTKGQNLKFTTRTLGEAPLGVIFEIITENWEADESNVKRKYNVAKLCNNGKDCH